MKMKKKEEKQPLKLKMRGEGDGRRNGASNASGWVDSQIRRGAKTLAPLPVSQNNPIISKG